MNFREHMQHIVEAIPGAYACALMGFDGILVDSYEADIEDAHIAALLAEYAVVIDSLQHAAISGVLEELAIRTDTLTVVLRPLDAAYFFAVVLKPAGIVGRAGYVMRLFQPLLRKELAST